MRVAVIGIGSNSVRMLETEIGDGAFRRLRRDRAGTRLFAGLDAEGNLSGESMLKTAEAVRRMAGAAQENGCERLHIFATSASRDAKNGADFMKLIRTVSGTELEIITGSEEAQLSFLGATDVVPEGTSCGVIDIGGGSTEIVLGRGREIRRAVSCQMGAVRLYNVLSIDSEDDLASVEEIARKIFRETWNEEEAAEKADVWIGTGGTFTALAAMVRDVPWTDRTCVHGTGIRRDEIAAIGRKLSGMNIQERLKLGSLQPGRADIVVHGICILLCVMDEMGIDTLTVSEHGNLDGYIKKKYGVRCR